MLAMLPALLLAPAEIRLEAEDAQILGGAKVATERPGYSGTGYVTGLSDDKARLVWKAQIPQAGVYSVRVRFATPGGIKGFGVTADGLRTDGMFPDTKGEWAEQSAGRVELKAGENEIALERGWGYYDADALILTPAGKSPSIPILARRLVDGQATPATQALYARIIDDYGRITLSGQYEAKDNDLIKERTGVRAAIYGGDLMEYSPSRREHGADPKNATEEWIKIAKAKQILTLSWHWNAPSGLLDKEIERDGKKIDARWYRGFYTEATTFNVTKAVDPKTEEHRLILRDIDVIAVELKKLADAGVPVLWRPLHEAEGGWFWWGAKGPEPCKALWRIVYERLVKHHNLHNLIWVWNSADPAWYPGDDTVDVVSVDHYPADRRDPLTSSWDQLLERYGKRKPLALAEFPGVPDIPRMRRLGVRWAYFVSWTGALGPGSNDPEFLKTVYRDRNVGTVK